MARSLLILIALTMASCPLNAHAQSNLADVQDATGPRVALAQLRRLSESSALRAPEGRALLAGELAEHDATSWGEVPDADRVLILLGGTAVARLPAQSEQRQDSYLYFRQLTEGRWVITAVRSLALMGIPMDLRRHLRALPARDAEQDWTLANLELTLASDAQLREWFETHRADLDRLRRLAEAMRRERQERQDIRVEGPEATELVRALHGLMLTVSAQGIVRLTIGGILDNEVGFLHTPEPSLAPAIDPGTFIWIEPLDGGWYLYKTT